MFRDFANNGQLGLGVIGFLILREEVQHEHRKALVSEEMHDTDASALPPAQRGPAKFANTAAPDNQLPSVRVNGQVVNDLGTLFLRQQRRR